MPEVAPLRTSALAVLALLAASAPARAAGDVDVAAPVTAPTGLVLAGGRVSLVVPPGLALAAAPHQVLVTPSPCREAAYLCLYLPEGSYAGTNLRSAGLAVTRRDDLRAPVSCLLAQPDGWSGLQPGVVYPEPDAAGEPRVATSRFGDVGEGAAGSYSVGELLRLFDGEGCWEVETRLVLTRFENYPPGQIEELTADDAAAVEALFWAVLGSAEVLGEPVPWPEEGESRLEAFVRVALPTEATSPLPLRGEARGAWFFEGSFPVRLVAADGRELASGYVTAQGDWTTEAFVPFEGELEFTVAVETPAVLVLERDNPSGLPAHDAAGRVRSAHQQVL